MRYCSYSLKPLFGRPSLYTASRMSESSHDSGGGIWLHEKRGLKVCQTTCHTRGALVFGFKRCQAVWVSVTYQNRACSNNRRFFQRQSDLKFRATSGSKYPPRYRGMTRLAIQIPRNTVVFFARTSGYLTLHNVI